MTTVPDEDTMENVYKKQLHYSEELKPLMALSAGYSPERGAAASYSRKRWSAVMSRRK